MIASLFSARLFRNVFSDSLDRFVTRGLERMRPSGRDGWSSAICLDIPGWSFADSLDPGLISVTLRGPWVRPAAPSSMLSDFSFVPELPEFGHESGTIHA